jgi:hypothetical protein
LDKDLNSTSFCVPRGEVFGDYNKRVHFLGKDYGNNADKRNFACAAKVLETATTKPLTTGRPTKVLEIQCSDKAVAN